ncbi:MAG TPA: acetyl-CoA carboxylase biotin carboxyl carrier protein subunit [Gemmatimonadales bacterium]|nr:acetyl-CoA carboxylase biotin carboxyl carrier protein subunit [Gemmatimonadales bacterium]
MKYFVRLAGRTMEVEVLGGAVRVDGETLDAHLAAVPGTPLHHLLLGGDSWTVSAQALEGMGQWALGAVGERVEVEAVDERTQAIRTLTGKKGGPSGGGVVKAPMPGLVVRVQVTEGQKVGPGTGLVVVEAMKMENELKATHPGIVKKVHVAPGAIVEKGAPLVTLESVEPSN